MDFMFENCKMFGYPECDPVVVQAQKKYIENPAIVLPNVEDINKICVECQKRKEEEPVFDSMPAGR